MSEKSLSKSSEPLSKYVQHLSDNVRARYLAKCDQLGVSDPYNLPTSVFTNIQQCNSSEMPDIGYHDLYNYLVNQQSYFTGKSLKAYKSLDAYKYFVAGWVSSVQLWKVPRTKAKLYLIMSRVSDSPMPSLLIYIIDIVDTFLLYNSDIHFL